MTDKPPKQLRDCLFTSSMHVSRYSEYLEHTVDARNYAIRDVRERLAMEIAGATMTTVPHDYSTEFRMSVYVFEPNDFWRIVEQEAWQIARRMK